MPPTQLVEAIYQTLQQSGIPIHGAQIEISGGKVTLRGETTSYFDQQQVQERVRQIPGVTQLENRLQIATEGRTSPIPSPHRPRQLSQSGSSLISGN